MEVSFGYRVDHYVAETLPAVLKERLGSDFIITSYTVWSKIFVLNKKHEVMNKVKYQSERSIDLKIMDAYEKAASSGDFTDLLELGEIEKGDMTLEKFKAAVDLPLAKTDFFKQKERLEKEKEKRVGDRGIETFQRRATKYIAKAITVSGTADRALASLKVHVTFCKLGTLIEEPPIVIKERFLRVCNSCQKRRSTENKLSKCVCLKTFYCNRKCLKADWSKHKKICYQRRGLTFCNNSLCLKLESPDQRLSQCARCLAVSYCNIDCQRKDWSEHKVVCQPPNK